MVQQVIVAALVHASVGIQELNVLVKKTTVAKRHFQGLQQFCFLFRSLQWVFRIDRREFHIQHRICFSVYFHRSLVKVHMFQ